MASSRPILAAIHFLSCFPTFRHMTTHMRREDFKVFRCFKSISVALVHLWTLLFNFQLFEGRCSLKANKGRFWGLWEVIMGWRSGTQQRFQIDCRHNQPHIRAWMMLSVNICATKKLLNVLRSGYHNCTLWQLWQPTHTAVTKTIFVWGAELQMNSISNLKTCVAICCSQRDASYEHCGVHNHLKHNLQIH